MSLPLTPALLEAAYEYLRATPPFRAWHLPPATGVKFVVTKHRDREGDHGVEGGVDILRVSSNVIGHTNSLLQVIGHEMIHMRQAVQKVRSNHNADFHRMARRACKYHGWDVKLFVGVI